MKKQKEQQEREFERLVERQRQTIYSVCYLFADERQQADDLFQEVLIRLWKGFDSRPFLQPPDICLLAYLGHHHLFPLRAQGDQSDDTTLRRTCGGD